MGEDVARRLMPGGRVQVLRRPGLHVVRLDSTASHNRSLLDGHGEVTFDDMDQVEAALAEGPPEALRVLMLHHHLLPLPVEDLAEKVATFLGWPNAAELPLGRQLLLRALGACQLVLHGHRHIPAESRVSAPQLEPLRIVNAGSTPELERARIFRHAAGRVLWDGWLHTDAAITPLLPVQRTRKAVVTSAA
jgi:hypothetical protein